MARAVLLEKPNHARTTRTTVEPESQRCRGWVIPSGEEPKPHIHVLPDGKITRVLLNAGSGLADSGVGHIIDPRICGPMVEDVILDAVDVSLVSCTVGTGSFVRMRERDARKSGNGPCPRPEDLVLHVCLSIASSYDTRR